jgi:AAA15 family ATPase/GTPase
MMAEFDQYNRWETQMKQVRLPHWQELPKFDLYMDQVVAFVNDAIGSLGIDPMTPAMINNYVKHQVIIAPVKKKYQTMQLADLILIGLLKPLFSTDTIRHGINQVTAGDFPKQAYDNFIDVLNEALLHLGEPKSITPAKTLNEKLMQVAVDTIINRIQSEQLLKMIEKPVRKLK